MRVFIVGVILAFSLLAAGVASASLHHNERGDYVAAPVTSSTQVGLQTGPFDMETTVGDITLDLKGMEKISVGVHDVISSNVEVYYSFHADDPKIGPLGEPMDAVGVGVFCSSTVMDVPADASVLRLSLNAPSTFDAHHGCLPGVATMGEWFLQDRTDS